jgi:hypothetical protein
MMSGFLNHAPELSPCFGHKEKRSWIDAAWGEVYPLGWTPKSEMLKK